MLTLLFLFMRPALRGAGGFLVSSAAWGFLFFLPVELSSAVRATCVGRMVDVCGPYA